MLKHRIDNTRKNEVHELPHNLRRPSSLHLTTNKVERAPQLSVLKPFRILASPTTERRLFGVHGVTAPENMHDRGSIVAWTILAGMLEVMVIGREEMLDCGRGVAISVCRVKIETLELLFVIGNLLEQAVGRAVVVHVEVERHDCSSEAFVLLVGDELAGVHCVTYMFRNRVERRNTKTR